MVDVIKARKGCLVTTILSAGLWTGVLLGVTILRPILGIPEGPFTADDVGAFPAITQVSVYVGIAWFAASMVSTLVAFVKALAWAGALDDV